MAQSHFMLKNVGGGESLPLAQWLGEKARILATAENRYTSRSLATVRFIAVLKTASDPIYKL